MPYILNNTYITHKHYKETNTNISGHYIAHKTFIKQKHILLYIKLVINNTHTHIQTNTNTNSSAPQEQTVLELEVDCDWLEHRLLVSD